MKNVLMVCANMGYTGVTSFLSNVMKAAQGRDCRFTLWFAGVNSEPAFAEKLLALTNGGEIVTAGLWGLHMDDAAFRAVQTGLREFISKRRFDTAVITTGNLRYQNAALVAINSHSHNTNFRMFDPAYMASPKIRKRQKYILENADVIAACSTFAGKWLVGAEAVEQGKCNVVLNTVDPKRFRYNETARRLCREQLGISPETPLLGMIGNMNHQKNQGFGLEITAALRRAAFPAKLLILGEGYGRAELEAKRTALDLDGHVFMPGSVPDVYRWLSAIDIFLLPSLYEGFPISALEAQCEGLPCLLSDRITCEVRFTDRVRFLPIDAPRGTPETWAEVVADIWAHDGEPGRDWLKDNDVMAHSEVSPEVFREKILRLYDL